MSVFFLFSCTALSVTISWLPLPLATADEGTVPILSVGSTGSYCLHSGCCRHNRQDLNGLQVSRVANHPNLKVGGGCTSIVAQMVMSIVPPDDSCFINLIDVNFVFVLTHCIVHDNISVTTATCHRRRGHSDHFVKCVASSGSAGGCHHG